MRQTPHQHTEARAPDLPKKRQQEQLNERQLMSRGKSLPDRDALHWKRRLFHFLNGYLLVLAYHWYCTKQTFLRLVCPLWVVLLVTEVWRLQDPRLNSLVTRLLGPVMRSHELHRFSGMLPYILGTMITAALFPKPVTIIAVVVLATADPVAALVGNMMRRYSSLDRWTRSRQNKSIIGSFAGFGSATFVIYLVLRGGRPSLTHTECFWRNCLLPSAAAAAVEWLVPSPQRTLPLTWFPFALDDNMLLPPLVAWTLQHTMSCDNVSRIRFSPWILF